MWRLGLLLGLCSVLVQGTVDAAWLRYVIATGKVTGITRLQEDPIPPMADQAVLDITTGDLDTIAAQAPAGCSSVKPEEWKHLLLVTDDDPLTVTWITPLVCFQGRLARSKSEVDDMEREELDKVLNGRYSGRGIFDTRLESYMLQRCTTPNGGNPINSSQCNQGRAHLDSRGPALTDVITILDAGNAARAALP